MDLVLLRQLILNIIATLPFSQKYIPESIAFQTPSSPGVIPSYSNKILIEELNGDELETNFVRVKIGDVNN